MLDRFKAQLKQLKASRPGHRFRDRYERNKKSKNGPKLFWRVVRIAASVGLVALGVVFVFIPGPAILFFALAGALLSTDSLPVAKLLDWTEVQGRRIGSKVRRHWRKLSPVARFTVAALGVCLSATTTILFYRFMAN